MPSDQEIGEDAAVFFKNMSIGNLDGVYRHLIVSPHKPEAESARPDGRGDRKRRARTHCHENESVTDMDFIRKTAEACQAGCV